MAGVTFGYNGVPWAWSRSPEDLFDYTVERVGRPLGGFGEEMVRAAREFGVTHQGEEIHVLYSGGLDSEAVLESLRRARIPHRAIVLIDTNGVNAQEVNYARLYVHDTGTPVEYMEFDFASWMNSYTVLDLCRATQQCYRALLLPMRAMIDRRDVVWLMGHDATIENCNIVEYEYAYAYFKFFLNYGIRGWPSLVQWNNAAVASYYADPIWDRPSPLSSSDDSKRKSQLMSKHLGLRPRVKVQWGGPPRLPSYHIREVQIPRTRWLKEHVEAQCYA